MYEIKFYESRRGESPLLEYMHELERKKETNKSARIELGQIMLSIELLERNGTNNNANITKKIEGDIWELRPGNNRILYYYYTGKTFILLHHFRKKTNKTPRKEIEKAKNEVKDFLEREGNGNENLD